MKSNTLKIIAIDNDPESNKIYNLYFRKYCDFELKGIYKSTDEALKSYDEIQPDIIISEILASGIDDVEGIRRIRKKDSNVKIIIISTQNDVTLIKKAFKNGVSGYLTKPISNTRLYDALNSIKYDGAAMSNDIAKKVISLFQRKSYDDFSKRENQIIDYLSEGETYKTIAEKLFVTPSAVNFHIQNIYLKLDVNSKSQALLKLRQLDFA